MSRLLLWMRLCVLRWAACLHHLGVRPDLSNVEAWLRTLLIIEASRMAGRPKRFGLLRPGQGARLSRNKRGAHDLAVGSLIRRTRKRDPYKRLAALTALLADFDRAVRKVAKRLSMGLARPRLVMVRPDAAVFSTAAPCAAVAFADSS